MRVKVGQHAANRRFDKFFVRNLFDIVGADPFEHVAEEFEQPICLRSILLLCDTRPGIGHKHGGAENRQKDLQRITLYPRTLSLAAVNQGIGLTGLPLRRTST